VNLVPRHGVWTIFASLVAALVLVAIPLPDWAVPWRPAWATLVLIHWCLAAPQTVGMGVAWTVGLLTDALTGTLLGQHALGMTLVADLVLRSQQRLRVFPLWHQAVVVFLLVSMHQSVSLWVNGIQGMPTRGDLVWLPALVSGVLWPWMSVILRDLRRNQRQT
jgi:rod shape-determining protein MreD